LLNELKPHLLVPSGRPQSFLRGDKNC